MGARYRFGSRWELKASAADVYWALYDLPAYPTWWPQFIAVRSIDPRHHFMVVRSFLPYRIQYTLTREVADVARGVLQGHVDGDIVGRIRWDIVPSPSGSVVYFAEKVETQSELLNMLAPIARLAFGANHEVMMRDGFIGLRAYLAARTVKVPAPKRASPSPMPNSEVGQPP